MGKLKDITGQTCGCWQVIERDMHPTSKSHETFWKCVCRNCGKQASVRKTDLDRKPKSCNKCKGNIISETMRNTDNSVWQIGDRYGKLVIIGKGEKDDHHTYVKVQCDCGSNPFDVRLEHLKGQGHGYTVSCGCASESAGEIKIRQLLEKLDIDFQAQYRIKNENNELMIFDFVIFDKSGKIVKCIEFNGEQHYHPVDFFGGQEAFIKQQERDNRKTEYCNTHAIILQWIPYYDIDLISPDYLNLK